MGVHTESASHWVEAGGQQLYGNTRWINITLGRGRWAIALWEHTLDQHHTGLRQVWSKLTTALWGHMLDQHHTGWRQVGNSSMGTHAGSTSHWVEAGLK